jgi:hypothetical protein
MGFQEKTEDGIILQLGQNTPVDFQLETSAVELRGVVVTGGRSPIFDNQRTGASTNISSRQLKQLPTISRSADDYTRLAPSASATIMEPRLQAGTASTTVIRWMALSSIIHLAWTLLHPVGKQTLSRYLLTPLTRSR